MRGIINKIRGTVPKTAFSSVMVVYQLNKDTWRGFVMPFDITFEGETRKEVVTVLRNMVSSYTEGLKEYKNPTHLSNVPLSAEPDQQKWHSISQDLTNNLLNKISRIDSKDYYAEAQLPA